MDHRMEQAAKSNTEVQVTSLGRKSKKEISTPLWFVQKVDKIYLLPMTGTDSNWYKNLAYSPSVKIKIGEVVKDNIKPVPIMDEKVIQDVLRRFRDKYTEAEVAKYYTKFDVCVEIGL